MTYLKSLTSEQQIHYILLLQKEIRNKFKNAFRSRIISSIEAKQIIDSIVWENENRNKHLYQITQLVLTKIDHFLLQRLS